FIIRAYAKNTRKTVTTWWDDGGLTSTATTKLKKLMGGSSFDTPKPIELIERMIKMIAFDDKSAIVLDFFSGSSTTAHSVMKINAMDGGQRKFIMVQLPEVINEKSEAYENGYRTISEIGQKRIILAGEELKKEFKKEIEENYNDINEFDIGFKVFSLDSSNIREWNVDFENLEKELDLYDTPFVEGRTELDVVYEIMLKYGLELTYPIHTFEVDGKNVYDIAFGNLFICLDKNINTNIAKAIIAKRDEYGTETSSVVFSDAGFAGNDSEKLNCIELLKDAGYPEDNLLTI
ncbi:hypothetical protein B5V88_12740, partial [Heyndrickxia sporothermodurans]